MPEGIETRHRLDCASRNGRRCSCKPGYRAVVRQGSVRLAKTFDRVADARQWRSQTLAGIAAGTVKVSTPTTLREAAESFLAAAERGTARTSSGDRYRAGTLRGYHDALSLRILPSLGAAKLGDVSRQDVQRLADEMLDAGLSASTVRNTLKPLQVIYRCALQDGVVAVNPTTSLRLPAVRGTRDRIAPPEEVERLLAALRPDDRALWATAFYAGLRRGEIAALDWSCVDLAAGVIRVKRSWHEQGGFGPPKSRAGNRRVPIPAALSEALVEHKLVTQRDTGLMFGPTASRPFTPTAVRRRALTAWKRAGLAPIGLHEARHTYASMAIAAGVNAKALSAHMGHSSITLTFDRYGHLMPGNEDEATRLLDRYLGLARHGAHGALMGRTPTETDRLERSPAESANAAEPTE
jgi:integrase